MSTNSRCFRRTESVLSHTLGRYRLTRSAAEPIARRRLRQAARLEGIESRLLLSAWTVNTLADPASFDTGDSELSLREAINVSASGDTIGFAPSLAGGTIVLSGTELTISDKDLVVQGPGAEQLTISGNPDPALYSRVFRLVGSTVTIQGLTITGGVGAAIPATDWSSYADWSNAYGGAIRHYSGTLTLDNCVLSGNSASLYGGAIYSESGTLTIRNSTFSGNSVGYDFEVIRDVYFDGRPGGGAIASRASMLTISGSTFSGNVVLASDEVGGGAIYSDSCTLTISDSTLNDNSAFADDKYCEYNWGGAIYATNSSTLTISNSSFGGNSTVQGGAIFSESSTLTVSNSIFSGNQAWYDGGAIFSSGGTLTISDSILSGNTATIYWGGAICSFSSTVITGCTLSGNEVGWQGGAIYSEFHALTIGDSTLSGNRSDFGGAICALYQSTLTISNSTLSGNKADEQGGAIFSRTSTLTLNSSTFSDNSVDAKYDDCGGGAIYSASSALTLNNTTFSGNSANVGGAIYLTSYFTTTPSALTLNSSTLSHNTAPVGGAIYKNSSSTAAIHNSIVSGNSYNGTPNDVDGVLDASSSHNLIGVGGGLTNGANGNIVGVTNPKLGPLADNGGPTWTMALLPGSPAWDAGDNSLIPAKTPYDQRGPGYDRIGGGTVDIGAYECQDPPIKEALARLLQKVESPTLATNVQSSLAAKLEAAMHLTGGELGSDGSPLALLDAFGRGVQQWLGKDQISPATGAELLADVNLIRQAILAGL